MVKVEFWDDEKLSKISFQSRLTYIGLWNFSDDFGVVKGSCLWLKNHIYPYDDLSLDQFKQWLNELCELKRLIPFTENGERFFYMPKFNEHQKINRPSTEKRNPTPPDGILSEQSVSSQCVLMDENKDKDKDKDKLVVQNDNRKNERLHQTFDQFWSSYPKKVGKKYAIKCWLNATDKPDIKKIIAAVERQKKWPQWNKDDGQFIPNPSTWINQGRWDDGGVDIKVLKEKPKNEVPQWMIDEGLV